MNRCVCFLLIVLSLQVTAQSPSLRTLADSFQVLNTKVRDGKIGKAKAKIEVKKTLVAIENAYRQQVSLHKDSLWVFPLSSYGAKSIGGQNGKGYQMGGYDYFDGNRHKGHPAHDIFIRDKNQDAIDDTKGTEINVQSVGYGVVVALEENWESSSALRGGKYVWVYDVDHKLLVYYAHNQRLKVKLGDVLKPGDAIGTVGRTGLNAFKARSPTHLHFMTLKLDGEYYPKPVNTYLKLIK